MARCVVPEPPWWTTAASRGKSQSCETSPTAKTGVPVPGSGPRRSGSAMTPGLPARARAWHAASRSDCLIGVSPGPEPDVDGSGVGRQEVRQPVGDDGFRIGAQEVARHRHAGGPGGVGGHDGRRDPVDRRYLADRAEVVAGRPRRKPECLAALVHGGAENPPGPPGGEAPGPLVGEGRAPGHRVQGSFRQVARCHRRGVHRHDLAAAQRRHSGRGAHAERAGHDALAGFDDVGQPGGRSARVGLAAGAQRLQRPQGILGPVRLLRVLALPPVGLRHLKVNEVAPGGADLVAEVGVRSDPGAHAQVAQPSGKRDHRRDAAPRVNGEQQNVSHPMDATPASTDTNKSHHPERLLVPLAPPAMTFRVAGECRAWQGTPPAVVEQKALRARPRRKVLLLSEPSACRRMISASSAGVGHGGLAWIMR